MNSAENSIAENSAAAKYLASRRKKRSWKRFGLRSCLLMLVIFSIAGAWYANVHSKARREQSVIEQFGPPVDVIYDYQFVDGEYFPGATPPGPYWMRNIYGQNAFANVVILDVMGSANSQGFANLKRLRQLETLRISSLGDLKDFEGIRASERLNQISIYACRALKNLNGLENIPNIETLSITSCHSLFDVSALKRMTNLKKLIIEDCPNISNFDPLIGHPQLETLSLSWTGHEKIELSKMPNLKFVGLEECQFTELSYFGSLPNLTAVKISDCSQLTKMDHWDSGIGIQNLEIVGCPKLKNIGGITQLNQLKELTIKSAKSVVDLDALRGLDSLEQLHLDKLQNLNNVSGINGLKNLNTLEIKRAAKLTRFDALKDLPELRSATLMWCNNLKSIELGGDLGKLSKLKIDGSGYPKRAQISRFTGLECAKNLKDLKLYLDLSQMENKSKLSGLNRLEKLESFWQWGKNWINNFDDLPHPERLQELSLTLNQNRNLRLGNFKNLETVWLERCEFENVDFLADQENLADLEVRSCDHLVNMDGIKHLHRLKKLNIGFCHALADFEFLEGLTGLEYLQLYDLNKFTTVRHVYDLEKLTYFGCDYCKNVSQSELTELRRRIRQRKKKNR